METWMQIQGWEGIYEVSDLGNIKRVIKHPKRKVFPYLLNPSKDSEGYLYVILTKDKRREIKKVHRLVAIHFIPNPENKAEVNHLKGIKADNRASELEWATRNEQEQHSIKIGLRKVGNSHFATKLKDEYLPLLKQLRKEGLSYQKIADIYKISVCQCHRIINGKARTKQQ